MQIVNNKELCLRLRNPHLVMDAIPDSQQLSEHEVIVKWGLDEAQILKNLGIRAPSPIEAHYDWPGKHKPFQHQKTTAGFLTLHRRAFCFNEQGTGKTAAAIWAADYLLQQGKINRVLVICPLSVMDAAWKADLATVVIHRNVSLIYGTKPKRKAALLEKPDFAIINYDGVTITKDIIREGGYDLLVIDEATAYKNVRTKRWQALRDIIQSNTWVWMLTGTPAAQSPLDAFGLGKIVNPAKTPRFFSTYRDTVMRKVSRFRYEPLPDATTHVFNMLQPAIRYTKKECLDLPEMLYTTRRTELTKQQSDCYEQIRRRLRASAEGQNITAFNAAGAINKLLQISSGSVYADDETALSLDIGNRYKVLREVIGETDKKILVYAAYKHVIARLTDELNGDGITAEKVTGEVSAKARADIFRRFQQTKEPRVLVLQPKAAAHGITLTEANTVVWWGPVSSLESYIQANARVHRQGQTSNCTVVHLMGSQAEKRLYYLLQQKTDVHEKIIELYDELIA